MWSPSLLQSICPDLLGLCGLKSYGTIFSKEAMYQVIFVHVYVICVGVHVCGPALKLNLVWKDIVWIVVLYVFVTACRMVIMQLFAYFVNNETIRWKESVLISWGEVRGPVNMILAFIVLHDPELSWVQHCPEGHTDAGRMFSRQFSGRAIGTCEGDISNISVAINEPVSWGKEEFTLSQLYMIAQQKIFFYGMGVLILNQIINTLRFVFKLFLIYIISYSYSYHIHNNIIY